MNIRSNLQDLRGAAQLACDATIGITGIVEQVHGTINRLPLPLGPMRRPPDAGLARLVYGSIRGTTRLVDHTIGAAINPFIANVPVQRKSAEREAFIAALNGVYGDHLVSRGNPLATPMALRIADTGGKARNHPRRWLILIHGLCMNDRQWRRGEHDHGEALAAELDFTPVYLRYNTGLGVEANGRELSRQLDQFMLEHGNDHDEIAIIAYSLGGLVARSAAATAMQNQHQWIGQLRQLVFLGTPHAGAPLAVGGHGLDRALEISAYSAAFARLGKSRSRGLHDLRRGLGTNLDELPASVNTFALAGALVQKPGTPGRSLIGDGLVPLSSALAQPSDRQTAAAIPVENQWTGRGIGHLDLLNSRAVYQQLFHYLA